MDSAFLHIFILRPALWIGGGQSYWWRDLRFALCTLQFCIFAVLHSFCMFRPALGGWWGEQLVTRERPHSSGRERGGDGRLLEEKQAVERHGRAGGAVAPTHTLRCRQPAADLWRMQLRSESGGEMGNQRSSNI